MTSATPPPPGWYVDPAGFQRWWDGQAWGPYAPVSKPQPQTSANPPKRVGASYVLLVFLGGIGAHQYYLRRVWHGIAYTVLWAVSVVSIFNSNDEAILSRSANPLTTMVAVAVAIMLVVDLFLIPTYVRAANAKSSRTAEGTPDDTSVDLWRSPPRLFE